MGLQHPESGVEDAEEGGFVTFATIVRPLLNQADDLPQCDAFLSSEVDSWGPLYPVTFIFRHRAKSSDTP